MKFNLSVDFGRLSIRFPPPGPFFLYLYIYLYIHSDSIKLHRQKKLLSSQKIILSFFCLHSTLLSGYDIFHLTSETKPLNPLFPSPPPLSSPPTPSRNVSIVTLTAGCTFWPSIFLLRVDVLGCNRSQIEFNAVRWLSAENDCRRKHPRISPSKDFIAVIIHSIKRPSSIQDQFSRSS